MAPADDVFTAMENSPELPPPSSQANPYAYSPSGSTTPKTADPSPANGYRYPDTGYPSIVNDVAKSAGQAASSNGGPYSGDYGRTAAEGMTDRVAQAKDAYSNYNRQGQDYLNQANRYAADAADSASESVDRYAKNPRYPVDTATDYAQDLYGQATRGVTDAANDTYNRATESASRYAEQATDYARDSVSEATSTVGDYASGVRDYAAELGNYAAESSDQALSEARSYAQDARDSVDYAQESLDTAADAYDQYRDNATDYASGARDRLAGGFDQGRQKLQQAANSGVSQLREGVSHMKDSVAGQLQNSSQLAKDAYQNTQQAVSGAATKLNPLNSLPTQASDADASYDTVPQDSNYDYSKPWRPGSTQSYSQEGEARTSAGSQISPAGYEHYDNDDRTSTATRNASPPPRY